MAMKVSKKDAQDEGEKNDEKACDAKGHRRHTGVKELTKKIEIM